MRILLLIVALLFSVQPSRASIFELQTTDNTVGFTGDSGSTGIVVVNLMLAVQASFVPPLAQGFVVARLEVNGDLLGDIASSPGSGTCHVGTDCGFNDIAALVYYFEPDRKVDISLTISDLPGEGSGVVGNPSVILTADFETLDFATLVFTPLDFQLSEGSLGGVPEPSTWAMMFIGFGGVGFMIYRRKRSSGNLSQVANVPDGPSFLAGV
jgi:hypothetical protein